MTVSHFLYLVRHGEPRDAQHGLLDGPLSENGKRQAKAVAMRLSGVPFTGAWHSPLEAATETAQIMTESMPSLAPEPSALLFDCIPSGPTPDMPPAFKPFFGSITDAEIEAGTAQMMDATAEWLTPSREDRHDLLITHDFVIAWFVREVFEAPAWRWMGTSQANCGVTIIRVRSVKSPELITHNDLGHLPVELRTGLSVPQPF